MHLMHLIIITSGGISRYNMHFSVTAIVSLWKLIVDVDRWWIGHYGLLQSNVFLYEARHLAKRVGNSRYFIVGNSMDGYSGIQRFMEHWKTPEGRIRWAFREL